MIRDQKLGDNAAYKEHLLMNLGDNCNPVTHDANRENTTVLAVCCTNGETLDALSLKEKKSSVNLAWKWLPGRNLLWSYWKWMNDHCHLSWLVSKDLKKVITRPLFPLFDGHVTHTYPHPLLNLNGGKCISFEVACLLHWCIGTYPHGHF